MIATAMSTRQMQSVARSSGATGRKAAAAPAQNMMALPSRKQRGLRVVAAANVDNKPAIAQLADSMGFPTSDGIFGFTPFAEVWVSRLAMMGFVTSIVQEATGHGGTLAQLGVDVPNPAVLATLLALVGGATLVGTGHTAYKLVTKKMTPGDIARYKNFLGLNDPNDFMAAAAEMKRRGDAFSLASDTDSIAAVRAAGMPADKVLATNTVAQADAAASELKARDSSVLTLTKEEEAAQVAAAAAEAKAPAAAAAGPSVSLAARADIKEQQDFFSANAEMRYARDVELTNGRAAQLGFLAAILVEAATGKGILLQIIMWLKFSGLLGAASGF